MHLILNLIMINTLEFIKTLYAKFLSLFVAEHIIEFQHLVSCSIFYFNIFLYKKKLISFYDHMPIHFVYFKRNFF